MKIVNKFQLKIIIFTAVKNHCILHGRVFVMQKYSTRRINHDVVQIFESLQQVFCFMITKGISTYHR